MTTLSKDEAAATIARLCRENADLRTQNQALREQLAKAQEACDRWPRFCATPKA